MMSTSAKTSRRAITWIVFGGLLLGCISTHSVVRGGEMYRWVDEQGRIHLTDTPPQSRGASQELKIYKPSDSSPQPERNHAHSAEAGGARLIPTKSGGAAIVEAVLNRRLTVPLVLDTGADLTVLTKQTAQALRIPELERLPRLQFGTAGGSVRFPITTLQSVRVGTAEAHDISIAIDIDGHLPQGLLGMSFLRHFKVTVDHQRSQITFER